MKIWDKIRSIVNNEQLFYVGSKKDIEAAVDVYASNYTKTDIVNFLEMIRSDQKTTVLKYVDSEGADVTVPDYVQKVFGPYPIASYYSIKKDHLMEALAYFNSDSRNENLRKHEQNSGVELLREMTAKSGAVDALKVCQVMGKDAVNLDSGSYWRHKVTLQPDIRCYRPLFYERRYSYKLELRNVYLRLPSIIVNDAVRSAYPPEPTVSDPNQDQSDETIVVNRMESVALQFSMAGAMLDSGGLTPSVNKLMNKTERKRFIKVLPSDPVAKAVNKTVITCEFDEENNSLEGATLMGFLYDYMESKYTDKTGGGNQVSDPANIVKNILTRSRGNMFKYPQIVKLLLPCISGLTMSNVRTILTKTVIDCLFDSLTVIQDKEWTPVDNVVHEAYRRLYIKNKELLVPDGDMWPYLCFRSTNETAKELNPGNIVKYMTFQLVRGYIYFLTAIGVLETSVRLRHRLDEESSYDCLRYTRLTPLGMFALDRGPHVDISVKIKYLYNYELIDNPLIIVALNPGNPYNQWLNRIGEQRGNRWVVTARSFLQHCRNEADLDSLIAEFRKYICKKLPPAWETFFKQLKSNVGRGSLVVETRRYVVCRINPENVALQRLLSTDPEFREMVIRAEGYRIMVPTECYDDFVLLLRNAGYMI